MDDPVLFEERIYGGTVWIALRSRGADYSHLTPAEAVALARVWLERYGAVVPVGE